MAAFASNLFRFSRTHSNKLVVGAVGGGLGAAWLKARSESKLTGAYASDGAVHAPSYPWSHRGATQSFDHASVRRGYYVFKEVCANCHSVSHLCYRNLVGVIMSEEEAKAEAANIEVPGDPNDEGVIEDRPGVIADRFQKPYPNEEAARFANDGAYPPDLSVMVKARHGGDDYLYALLTGYEEPPAGVVLREGLYYNPYFDGGAIGMAQALMPDMVEYDDGTEATVAQMAKDVTTFLCWAAEPEHDERKEMGVKTILILSLMLVPALYFKRLKWAGIKSRVIQFKKY
eukprot:TRINITY_DN17290_c0_g1_i1.p1 TRINITY_DN17290_c0_g1~~TRINITY_DN17290_c0_g1_i1.p1  ORF type:complete len:300 (+),score=71.97 TRINITY_DN17290_c0_g1_i1:41-901(+)